MVLPNWLDLAHPLTVVFFCDGDEKNLGFCKSRPHDTARNAV